MYDSDRAVGWVDDQLQLLDQRKLPQKVEYLTLDHATAVADAIKNMVVRGAPAIGITAAYAVVLAARQRYQQDPNQWQQLIIADMNQLAAARPTAVNLCWALEHMQHCIDQIHDSPPVAKLLFEAQQLHQNDIAANKKMGELGAALLSDGQNVLTHCNAGALATGGYGTALGVIRSGYASQKIKQVYADETRPWLQGTRLTAWELQQENIPVSVLADGAAAYLMQQGKVDWVIVGSDRIAANGDVANKIGTYSTAVAARHHQLKFMVVAPTSTLDMATATGADIKIEARDQTELLSVAGQTIAPEGMQAWNPVFDITPAALIDAIVTEKGVVLQPNADKIANMMKN